MMIDQNERKALSIKILQQLNVPVLGSLPVIEAADEIRLRRPSDIARRLLCLMLVSDVARNADPVDCINYLRKYSLFENLSPAERDFIDSRNVTDQVRNNLSWRCEAAYVLLGLQLTGGCRIEIIHDLGLVRHWRVQSKVKMSRCNDGRHALVQRLHHVVGEHDDDAAAVKVFTVVFPVIPEADDGEHVTVLHADVMG